MKKRAVLVLLAGMILCSAEELSISEGLPGWLIASKTAKIGKNVVFDPEVKVSKSGSIKFTSPAAVMKRFKLEPGAEYEISYYVKADKVECARLLLNDGKKYLSVPADGYKSMAGTFDWRKCTRTIKSSSFGKDMINVVPTMTGNGTAWFDDIRIEKKTADANKKSRKSLSPSVVKDLSISEGLPGWLVASKTAKIGKNVVFDPEVKVSKSGSMKFTSAAAAMKRFKLEPGAEYEVSYYVKADQTDRALLWLNDGKKYLSIPADGSKTMTGTFDWRKCTRTIKSSFFGKDVINVVPTMTGNGTAWFDDIRIEKKTADANKGKEEL